MSDPNITDWISAAGSLLFGGFAAGFGIYQWSHGGFRPKASALRDNTGLGISVRVENRGRGGGVVDGIYAIEKPKKKKNDNRVIVVTKYSDGAEATGEGDFPNDEIRWKPVVLDTGGFLLSYLFRPDGSAFDADTQIVVVYGTDKSDDDRITPKADGPGTDYRGLKGYILAK